MKRIYLRPTIAAHRTRPIFNRRGKLLLIRDTDPWWKRLWGKLTGRDIWHQTGFYTPGCIGTNADDYCNRGPCSLYNGHGGDCRP